MGLADWVKQVTKTEATVASASLTALPAPKQQAAHEDMSPSASTADQPDAGGPSTRWIGFIDRVTLTAIEGWAHDAHNPNVPVTVEVVTSKGKRVAALAHMYRKDVEDAGLGAGICGFFLDLSKLQLTDESAIVRFAGSKHPITKEPISFDPGRAVLTTDMPGSFFGLMGQLAAETRQTAEMLDATA